MRNLLLLPVVILAITLVFSILTLERNIGIQNYPLKVSLGQRFLATISQVFETGPEKRIKVDLSQQKIKIFENGEMVNEFSVSTGKRETPTPDGKEPLTWCYDFKTGKISNQYQRNWFCWKY